MLARKYRPRNFETLVGQAHVVQALANALTQQRLHHAYLFTGTRGVGKTTIARILAKSLNCTGPDGSGGITAQPCGVCAACRDIDAGRFIDYVELDAASNRGVDEITRLLDQAVYKPVVGRFKVYLIDEVHMLSTTAFNAMLKTLEEPPDYLKFILATTDPQKVPATVLSRCLQFNLRPMAPETIVVTSRTILADRGRCRRAGRAEADRARGARLDARRRSRSPTRRSPTAAAASRRPACAQMLGAVDRSHAVALHRSGGGARRRGAHRRRRRLRELGLSAAGALEEMAALLQEMAIVQAVPSALADDDPDGEVARRLAALLPADETQLLYSMVLAGRAEIALAPDEYSGLVMVLLRMLAFAPADARATPHRATDIRCRTDPGTDRRTAIDGSSDGLGDDSSRRHQRRPRQPPSMPCAGVSPDAAADRRRRRPRATTRRRPSIDGPPAADLWTALVQRLVAAGAIAAMVRELAMQAQCVRVVDGAGGATLAAARRAREPARAGAARSTAGGAGASAKVAPVRLEIEAGAVADTPAARDAAERDRRQAEAERVIQDDPLVQGADGAVQDGAHRAGLGQAAAGADPDADRHARRRRDQRSTRHDEGSTGRPDEAGAGDAGQPEEGAGRAGDDRGRGPVGRRASSR